MSLNLFWFLPTHGDGHYLGTEEGSRPVDHGYLQQIAQAADRIGFTGVLIPTGRSCEDAAGRRVDDPGHPASEVLVALRPSVVSPTVAARQAATLDRLSNGRALFNGDGQRSAGAGGRWGVPRPYRALRSFRRVHPRLATSAGR